MVLITLPTESEPAMTLENVHAVGALFARSASVNLKEQQKLALISVLLTK